MALTGKRIGVYLTEAGGRSFYGMADHIADQIKGPLFVGGEVVEETPELGMWVSVECIAGSPGSFQVIPDSARATFLVRWEWVIAATMLPASATGPEDFKAFGFRPPLSDGGRC